MNEPMLPSNAIDVKSHSVEERTKDLRDYLQFFQRRRKQMLIPFLSLFVLGAIVTFSLPAVYRSTATILIEEQEVPADLVRSTVTSYADQRIETIKHQVMSRANLLKIIDEDGLYPKMRKKKTTEALLKRFADDINVEVINAEVVDRRTGQQTHATIAFTLSYDGETPELAQKVSNELTSLFLSENIRTRSRNVQETTAFLNKEAQTLSNRIEQLEKKIALFKQRADGALPEMVQLNMQLMNQSDRELMDVDREIRNLEDRKILLEGQLATLKPNTPIMTASGERILDTDERLKALRAQYLSAASNLSPQHPDLIKMKRELEALEKETQERDNSDVVWKRLTDERAKLATLTQRYSDKHPDVIQARKIVASLEEQIRQSRPERAAPPKPENPAYIMMQTQLTSAINELSSMRATRESLKRRAADLARRLEKTPSFEQQYLDLTRDRDNSVLKYHEIRSKLLEAQVSEGLESQRMGERFSLIDPPAVPEKPEKPRRSVILLLSMIFATVGGVGYGAAKENLDHSIYTADRLWQITEAPPLVVVPYIVTSEDLRLRRRRRIKTILITMILVASLLTLCHLFWVPLDVIWYSTLRRFGIEY
ncbi:MAG: lipopolysaccharide biosynthesis protein [Nitrospirae bacterium]|nr:lipopolysaccharide biosynthesis protein [Candidatus Manganitrophaceae bacterium]